MISVGVPGCLQEAAWQVPPRAARPGPEEDPVDHRPVIGPPAAALPRAGRQEHPQALPFLIGQVMTIQAIRHRTGLHDPASKIHGTRPSGRSGGLFLSCPPTDMPGDAEPLPAAAASLEVNPGSAGQALGTEQARGHWLQPSRACATVFTVRRPCGAETV